MAAKVARGGPQIAHRFERKTGEEDYGENLAKNPRKYIVPAVDAPGTRSGQGSTDRFRDRPRFGGRIHAKDRRQRLPAASIDGERFGLLSPSDVTDHQPPVELFGEFIRLEASSVA
jgi:hypothetical protein